MPANLTHVDVCEIHDQPADTDGLCAGCERPEGARTPPEQEAAY